MNKVKPSAKALVAINYRNLMRVHCIGGIVRGKVLEYSARYLEDASDHRRLKPTEYPSAETWVVSELYNPEEVVKEIQEYISTL